MAVVRRVVAFSPKVNGLHFANAWPHDPIVEFRLGTVATLTIGDAANGLCGGTSFVVRDLFEHGVMPPPDTVPPPAESLRRRYIIDRQVDSFDNGLVPWRFYTLMDPRRPATEPALAGWLGRIGIDRHSRTHVMVAEEWPKICADIDANRLSTVGLVKVIDRDPLALGRNHQVLAYGYELDVPILTLRIYDPNYPNADNVTLSLDVSNARGTVTPTWSQADGNVVCFFRAPYARKDPTPYR